MSDAISSFLGSIVNHATKRAYKSDLIHFSRSVEELGNTISAMDKLPTSIIQLYFSSLRYSELKATTQRRRLASLRAFYKWSVKTGRIEKDPTDLIRFTSFSDIEKREVTTLSKMNAEHLHLDADFPYVNIPQSRGLLSIQYRLPKFLVRTLQDYKEHYGIISGPLWRSFSRRNPGGRLTPTSIYRIVRDTAVAAGLPGAHTLRHTGCTLAIEAGASIQQVQSHARHKQIETTMVYVHQRNRLRDSAADYINLEGQNDR